MSIWVLIRTEFLELLKQSDTQQCDFLLKCLDFCIKSYHTHLKSTSIWASKTD